MSHSRPAARGAALACGSKMDASSRAREPRRGSLAKSAEIRAIATERPRADDYDIVVAYIWI